MRDLDSSFVAAATAPVKQVTGSVKFRDPRLQLTSEEYAEAGLTSGCATVYDSDASVCTVSGSTGLLRAVSDYGLLHWVFWPDPSDPYRDPWVSGSVATTLTAGVGVEGARIWFVSSDGKLKYTDFNGTGLDAPTIVLDCNTEWGTEVVSLAPISSTVCYVQVGPLLSPLAHSELHRVLSTGTIDASFHGRIYGDPVGRKGFDAVTLDGVDYVYVTDRDSGRTLYTAYENGYWSELRQVVPLDVVDDLCSFSLGAANVINDKIFVTGHFKRSEIEMDIYLMSKGRHYSMARDMFVTADFGSQDYRGKMHLVDTLAVWQGFGGLAYGEPSIVMGVENASLEATTQDVHSWDISSAENNPSSMQLDVAADLDLPAIRAGGEAEVYLTVSGSSALIGTFGLDIVSTARDEGGWGYNIAGRGAALRKMDLWESDQSYDLWSQTKDPAYPYQLSHVVNVEGWATTTGSTPLTSGSAALSMERLNEVGYFYDVERACRGASMRGLFVTDTASGFAGRYGVGVNYYRESRAEAAARMGVDSESVQESQYGHNGIFAIMESGSVGVYRIYNSEETELVAPVATGLTITSPHWLMILFQDGYIKVSTKAAGSVSWTTVIEYVYQDDVEPWFRDDIGRGALLLHNETAHSATPGFDYDQDIIPVDDATQFPSTETVNVHDELIVYNGVETVPYNLGDLSVTTNPHSYIIAPHDNSLWTNITFRHYAWNDATGDTLTVGQSLGYSMYALQAIRGPYGRERIDKVRVPVKKIGTPTKNLYCYLARDPFDDTGPPWYTDDVWMTSYVLPSAVSTNFGWVEFDFTGSFPASGSVPNGGKATDWTTRWIQQDYGKGIWIVITTVPPGTNPTGWQDASNYYEVMMNKYVTGDSSLFLCWGDDQDMHKWSSIPGKSGAAVMPFQIAGIGNRHVPGYELWISGSQPVYGPDTFDDLALVVTAGEGIGSVFKVLAYDYQAPDDWEATETYEPPEKWEDHVGDPAHGIWVTGDYARFIVQENPSGIVGEGSQVRLYDTLLVTERASGSTAQTTHSAGTVSVYRTGQCSVIESAYFSTEIDMRMQDLIEEIAAKAGVFDCTFQADVSGSIACTAGGTPAYHDRHRNAIIEVDFPAGGLPAGDAVGAAVRITRDPVTEQRTSGYRVQVRNYGGTAKLELLRFSIATGWSTVEQCTLDAVPAGGTMRISAQNECFAVWINRRYIHAFVDRTLEEGDEAAPWYEPASGSVALTCNMAALDRRVDNFILDMGGRGTQFLGDVFGDTRAMVFDSPGGGIWAGRRSIGEESTVVVEDLVGAVALNDEDAVNRTVVRIEGTDIVEAADYAALAEEGFLFSMGQASYANDIFEVAYEADDYLDDMRLDRRTVTITGPADPRIEPNDVLGMTLPEGEVKLICRAITQRLDLSSEADAIYEMQLECSRAIE